MNGPIYVVIPFKGKKDLTHALCEQLHTQGEATHIFLFDNGTDEEYKYTWDELGDISTSPAKGANIHEMWNMGYAWAQYAARYWEQGPAKIAFLNNDIKIPPRFLSTLAFALDSDPLLAAVGPELEGDDREANIGNCGIFGSAFMIPDEELHQPFDQNLKWWYGDDDFCMRARARGLKVALVRGLKHTHIEGGSQTERPPEFDQAVREDRDYFFSKWPEAAQNGGW